MRIGIYLGRHAGQGGGIGIYARSLVCVAVQILEQLEAKETEIVLYGDRSILNAEVFDQLQLSPVLSAEAGTLGIFGANRYFRRLPNGARCQVLIRMLPQSFGRYLDLLTDQVTLPWLAFRDRLDLLHSVANYGLLLSGKTQVVTVHDLYQAWPVDKQVVDLRSSGASKTRGVVPGLYRLFFRLHFPRVAQIITDTKHVAREIKDKLACPMEKIRTIPLGLDRTFSSFWRSRKEADQLERNSRDWLVERSLVPGYVLLLASSDPRKNLKRSLEAWCALNTKGCSCGLVIKALDEGAASLSKKILGKKLSASPLIRHFGWIDRCEMPYLYRNASVVLAASLAEGFGMVPLEVLASGGSVVSGELEVLSGSGLSDERVFLCDPLQVESISAAVSRALEAVGGFSKSKAVREESPPRSMEDAIRETFALYRELLLKSAAR